MNNNFEKLKTMNQQEFAASIAAVVATFKEHTDKSLAGCPPELWGIIFSQWLIRFLEDGYRGQFETPEGVDAEKLLRDMLNGRRRNPFED